MHILVLRRVKQYVVRKVEYLLKLGFGADNDCSKEDGPGEGVE
jgi:hypothetical protein